MPLTEWLFGQRAAPRRGLVIVHGAGHFPPGYERDLIRRIQEELRWQEPPPNLPVCYAHLTEGADADKTRLQVAEFKSTFRNQIEYDQIVAALIGKNPTFSMLSSILGASNPLFSLVTLLPQFLPGDFLKQLRERLDGVRFPGGFDLAAVIEQVGRYLFDAELRNRVQGEVVNALDQAARTFDEIVLVSHSLGTLVSYDVLRARADQYKIAYWFTLGSPIAKVARVRSELKDLGKISRATVAWWFNVYDDTDFIANALGKALSTPACPIYDVFVNVATDPISSHDYFTNPPTIKLIADVLR